MGKRRITSEQIVHIYGLKSNLEDKIRYIGWASNLTRRLQCHIYEATNPDKSTSSESHKNRWIRKILSENGKISIIPIEEIEYRYHNEKERYWIKKYERKNLTNGTNGGDDTDHLRNTRSSVPNIYAMKLKLWHCHQRSFLYSVENYTITMFGTSISNTSGSMMVLGGEDMSGNYCPPKPLHELMDEFYAMENPYLKMSDEEIERIYFDYINKE